MKIKNKSLIIVLGIATVAVVVIGILLVVFKTDKFTISKDYGKSEMTTVTTQSVADQKYGKDSISQSLTVTGENYNGNFIVSTFGDSDAGRNPEVKRILLVSPSNKTITINPNDKEDSNIVRYSDCTTYIFENPLEVGTWKTIIYGNNITSGGTSATFSVEYVDQTGVE